MKFPLADRPFPGVLVSEAQANNYDALTKKLVAATLREYDQFVHANSRTMDRSVWKPVKSRDDVTVYKYNMSDPFSAWTMPKLVAVGTIPGSLEDVMYGIVTPDAKTIRVKTSYVNDELLDGAVLHKIDHPTVDDPFRLFALKWIAMGHPHVVNAVVRPRDFIFVESTGLHHLSRGGPIGFHAIHSVEHPHCPELTSLSIIRARLSNCYLYRQLRPDVVEIYMKTYSDPGGNPPERIAIMSAANTLIGMWKSPWCAQNKKLSFILQDQAMRERFRMASLASSVTRVKIGDTRFCNLCCKPRSSLRSANPGCELCSALVCVRCRVARKLSAADDKLELSYQVVQVCKRCIARVANMDSWKVARMQYVPEAKVIDSPSNQWSQFDSSRTIEISRPSDVPTVSPANSETSEPDALAIETIDDWMRTRNLLVLPSAASDTAPIHSNRENASLCFTATPIDQRATHLGDDTLEF